MSKSSHSSYLAKSIAIIDFGSQSMHLLANKIRNLGAHSIIVNSDTTASELQEKNVAGVIISGGPDSVYLENSLSVDTDIFELNIPVLGVCYGHNLIADYFGGKVQPAKVGEYGKVELNITNNNSKIFSKKNIIPQKSIAWMTHGDEVSELPADFEIIASTEDCKIAAMQNTKKNIFGFQYHPELSHSEFGVDMLENFVEICGVSGDWTLNDFIDEEVEKIQKQCEGKKVFLLVSGGVDSSVCFALLTKALGKDRVFGCLVDHGMMRLNEADEVTEMLKEAGFDLHTEEASDKFLGNLAGKFDPEEKRNSIGNDFLELQAEIAERMNLNPNEWLLGQGTIYPDTIESGATKNSDKIKTHHNRVERIQIMIEKGLIIEPIVDLYKDEVRKVGTLLGLSDKLISRHPFPGPGLGVRVLCAKSENILENADIIEEKINNLNTDIKLKAKVLPIKSVGVEGDKRSYKHPIVLYPQNSLQSLPNLSSENLDILGDIASDIANSISDINRVLISVSRKNIPEKFTVEKTEMTKSRIKTLQKCDAIVRNAIFGRSDCSHIWQFPVVLAPAFVNKKESIILRPIESENAMTAIAAPLPNDVLEKIILEIQKEVPEIESIFYDLTGKPPGTIEWE